MGLQLDKLFLLIPLFRKRFLKNLLVADVYLYSQLLESVVNSR